jgi:hypothetical protein
MVMPFPLRPAGPLFAVSAALLVCRAAHAADPPAPSDAAPEKPAWETQEPEHRGGLTVGLALGAGVASMAGFPADAKKVNRLRYYTETGVRPTGIGTFWIGSAVTDWFSFGIGITGGGLLPSDNESIAGGLVFHVEAFPLFPFGGRLRDLGVMLNTGVGIATVTPNKDPNHSLIDGTGCSLFGGGVFYEGFRVWRLSSGPFLAGDYYWSDYVRRPSIFLGWRTSLYTSP